MARKKPCTQSSTEVNYGIPNDALYANDGLLTTRSYTKKQPISWWEVDMQQLVVIDSIVLHLDARALEKGYYGNVFIKTRAKDTDSLVLCTKVGVPRTVINTLECGDITIARYLRVTNENGDSFALFEVAVYGTAIVSGIFQLHRKDVNQ